jgi:hypothetical protein
MQIRLSLLIAVAITCLQPCLQPALAQGSGSVESSGASETKQADSAVSSNAAKRSFSAKSFAGHLPQSLASVAVGTLVGTPIALVRCTKRELVKQTKECYTLGGVPKPLGYVTAAFFGIPSGILCGAWYGVPDGLADACVNSDEPFGKASFSLEELEW